LQGPIEFPALEVEPENAVEAGRGQVEGALINRNLVAVLEIAVTPAPDPLEVRRVGEKFVTRRDVDRFPVECDAAKAAIPAAAMPVDVGGVPVEGLADGPDVKIDQVYAAVTFSLLAAADDRGCNEFQKLFRTVRLIVRGFCNESDRL
jgi:hypothetical protein